GLVDLLRQPPHDVRARRVRQPRQLLQVLIGPLDVRRPLPRGTHQKRALDRLGDLDYLANGATSALSNPGLTPGASEPPSGDSFAAPHPLGHLLSRLPIPPLYGGSLASLS